MKINQPPQPPPTAQTQNPQEPAPQPQNGIIPKALLPRKPALPNYDKAFKKQQQEQARNSAQQSRSKGVPLPRGRSAGRAQSNRKNENAVEQDESFVQQWEWLQNAKDPLVHFNESDQGEQQQGDLDGQQSKEDINKLKQKQAEAAKNAQQLKDAGQVKKKDGFEIQQARLNEIQKAVATTETTGAETLLIPDEPPKPAGKDPIAALNNSQAPGVFFKEDGRAPEQLDPSLLAAIEELKTALKGLPGIGRIFPATNEEGKSLILVAIEHGVTDVVLGKVPFEQRGFEVDLAIPFDLLPIKRERPPAATCSTNLF